MDVVRSWQDVPGSLKGAALAIGNFDGVHRGHQAVLLEAKRIADAEGRRSGAVVFEPHPRAFFAPDQPFFYLTPLPLKLELLAELGLDQTFVIPFDRELSSLSAEAFATEVVAQGLGASHVVVGYDFTYGKGRTGTTEGLAAIGRAHGFGVDVVAPVARTACTFSSSSISEHLRKGEMRRGRRAARLLVADQGHGRARPWPRQGARLPHAQPAARQGQDVAHGIYAMRVYHKGRRYAAAGYVGSSPTFGEARRRSRPISSISTAISMARMSSSSSSRRSAATAPLPTGRRLPKQMQEDCEAARIVLRNIEAGRPDAPLPLGPRARKGGTGLSRARLLEPRA